MTDIRLIRMAGEASNEEVVANPMVPVTAGPFNCASLGDIEKRPVVIAHASGIKECAAKSWQKNRIIEEEWYLHLQDQFHGKLKISETIYLQAEAGPLACQKGTHFSRGRFVLLHCF